MLTYLFKSLYKNSVIVEQRKRPWWIALILGILSITIILIPTIIKSVNVRGSSILTSTKNYELDKGLVLFANDEPDCSIDGEGMLVCVDERLLATKEGNPIKYKVDDYQGTDGTKKTAVFLEVFYYDQDPLKDKDSQQALTDFIDKNIFAKDEEGKITKAPHSYLILTKSCFFITLYNPTNTETDAKYGGSLSGLYDRVKNSNLKDLKGDDFTATLDNWKVFLDKSYETTKNKSALFNVLLTAGMNVLIILIGGVICYIGLRGKHTQYGDITFLEGMKISFTMSFSPAIIGMILTFFMGGIFGTMGLILPFGMRLMWLISKSRSNPSEGSKPVYQARS